MSIHHLSHNERKQYGKLLKVTRQQAHLLPHTPEERGVRRHQAHLVWTILELLQLLLQ